MIRILIYYVVAFIWHNGVKNLTGKVGGIISGAQC